MVEKRIRIIIISNMYPSKADPCYGSFVKNFVTDLKDDSNFLLDLVVIRGRSYSFILKMLSYLKFYFQIFFYLITNDYNIVYVHIVTHASPILRLVSLFKTINIIFNIHGEDLLVKTRRSNYLLKIAYPLLCNSVKVVVPSLFFKNRLYSIFPIIKKEQIFISPSGGISSDNFYVKQTFDRFTYTVAYVSRIDRGKGWNIVLDAIEVLNRKYDLKLRCLFVGGGGEVDKIKTAIYNRNLTNCVYIGPLPQDRLSDIYSNADFMLFPTELEESLGLVGVEALSCSCPVIGSMIGCLPEYIKEGINGFLFEPGNSNELVDKIRLFYSLSIEDVNKMKREAYEISLKYDSKKTSMHLVEMLTDIANYN